METTIFMWYIMFGATVKHTPHPWFKGVFHQDVYRNGKLFWSTRKYNLFT